MNPVAPTTAYLACVYQFTTTIGGDGTIMNPLGRALAKALSNAPRSGVACTIHDPINTVLDEPLVADWYGTFCGPVTRAPLGRVVPLPQLGSLVGLVSLIASEAAMGTPLPAGTREAIAVIAADGKLSQQWDEQRAGTVLAAATRANPNFSHWITATTLTLI